MINVYSPSNYEQVKNEYINLEKVLPEGVHLFPSSDFKNFDGIIFVKNGYWKGSVYSFKLVLGNIIAEKNRFKPYIQITSKSLPFHPLVHPENGKIANLTDNSNLGTLEKLIDNLYKIFETPLNLLIAQAEYILNEEALSVFSMNVEEFKKIANENVKLSLEELNENMKKEQL